MINTANLPEIKDEFALGELRVLSIHRGDLRIKFNSADKAEVEKAKVVVEDMLAKGYMIFVEVGGKQKRVKKFDAKTCEYIVDIDKRTKTWKERDVSKSKQRVKASKTKAVGIAPSGGG